MQKTVVIFGGSIFNRGLFDKLKNKGIKTIVVDRNKTPDLMGDYHVQSDVLDLKYIIKKLRQLGLNEILGSYTSADIAIKSVNLLNRAFNLTSIAEETLNNISSKNLMITKWKKNGLFNRISKEYSSLNLDELISMNNHMKLVIKPNNASSSRGLTILNKDSNVLLLENAFTKALNYSSDNKVLVEEFIEGREMTVELLGDNYGNISVYGISLKYHTINTINNKIAVKLHYNPIELDEKRYHDIAKFGIECYKTLNLRNSFGHLEIMEKKDGSLTPIEINARSAGFVASNLVDVSSGRDYFNDYLNILNNKKLQPRIFQTNFSSMYFFYDFPKGVETVSTTHLLKYLPLSIKSLYNDRSNLVPGKKFDYLNCDNDRYGFEILIGHRNELTYQKISEAEKMLLMEFMP
jgi:biotin carboxylase